MITLLLLLAMATLGVSAGVIAFFPIVDIAFAILILVKLFKRKRH